MSYQQEPDISRKTVPLRSLLLEASYFMLANLHESLEVGLETKTVSSSRIWSIDRGMVPNFDLDLYIILGYMLFKVDLKGQ